MNNSLLFHAFGFRNQKVISTRYQKGNVYVKVKTKKEKLKCSECKSFDIIKAGTKERIFHSLPIGNHKVFIKFQVQRLNCKKCGVIRQEHLSFAKKKKSFTRAFARYVMDLSKIGTIKDIALHLGVGWDLIKAIQKEHLQKHYSSPQLKDVRYIAIDEFAVKKGHKYMTVVMDIETGIVLHVGKGKGGDALTDFWKQVKKTKIKIEAVAIDMSPAFISAVTRNLPNAQIIFDHFHIVKIMNDTITKLRRDLYRQETVLNKKELLKGSRWLLLKNNFNLDDKRNEKEKLKEILAVNEPLSIAYYLKEELKLLWRQRSKNLAQKFLGRWVAKAMASGIQRLKKFANTLLAHRSGIFSWYDYPISTGPLEGLNNKIKTMKRQAYGYRDMEFFKLKILSLHEKKYALVG